MRGKHACCIALYDWQDCADVALWLEYCEQLFTRAGVQLELGVVQGSGFSGKPVTFKRLKKRLSDRNVLDRCPVVGLFSMEFSNYHSLTFGWRVHMSMEKLQPPMLFPMLFFGFDELTGICGERLVKSIFKECLKWSSPVYGIAYYREFEKSPDGYAVGLIAGLGYSPKEDAERQSIGDWNREQLGERRHLKGMLRDVYPWNFLSNVHLASRCGALSLREWITSGRNRGTLESLGSERYCWSVPAADHSFVRAELAKNGLLICR